MDHKSVPPRRGGGNSDNLLLARLTKEREVLRRRCRMLDQQIRKLRGTRLGSRG